MSLYFLSLFAFQLLLIFFHPCLVSPCCTLITCHLCLSLCFCSYVWCRTLACCVLPHVFSPVCLCLQSFLVFHIPGSYVLPALPSLRLGSPASSHDGDKHHLKNKSCLFFIELLHTQFASNISFPQCTVYPVLLIVQDLRSRWYLQYFWYHRTFSESWY